MSDQQKENTPIQIRIDKGVETENRQDLKQLILDLTEQRQENKFSDEYIDRENEKIELLSGKFITIKEIKNIISNALQEYSPKYPKEYYKEINRLNKWSKPEEELYHKPPIVGRWTNEIIYGRFSKEILSTLQTLNPYITMGFRKHKHFQWLNEEGQRQLVTYIEDSIRVMKKCNDWYEFRIEHAKEFKVSFQLNFLEDNSNLL